MTNKLTVFIISLIVIWRLWPVSITLAAPPAQPPPEQTDNSCQFAFSTDFTPNGTGDLSDGYHVISSSPSTLFAGHWIRFVLDQSGSCEYKNKRIEIISVNGRNCSANLHKEGGYWNGTVYHSDAFPGGACDAIPLGLYDLVFFQLNSWDPFTVEFFIGDDVSVGGELCEALPDGDFQFPDVWSLYNSAVISGGVLSLPATGYAENIISNTLQADTRYAIVMTATGATTGTNSLMVQLIGTGLVSDTIIVTDTALYTLTLRTGPDIEITPTIRLIGITGQVDIDFVCLSLDLTFDGEYGQCLEDFLPNGNFDDDSYWIFVNGAVYDDVGLDAWVPVTPGGTWANSGLGAVGQTPLTEPLPELLDNEYFILQFDARTNQSAGTITARYRNADISHTVELSYTFSTSARYTTYQTDFSDVPFEENSIEIGFFNEGEVYSDTAGFFVDNVCLFVSDRPPDDPMPGSVGLGVNCANVSQWLSDTLGIDFPSLEQMETPSLWDVDEWVPWLASRLWIWAGKPVICVLLALFEKGPGLALLNWIQWFVRQPDRVFAWLGSWLARLIDDGSAWLIWFGASFLNLGNVLRLIFLGYEFLAGWAGEIAGWLWEGLKTLASWAIGTAVSWSINILNTLVLAWNILLPSVSMALSDMVNAGIRVWNNHLAPYLSNLGGGWSFLVFLIDQVGVVWQLIVFLFQAIWGLAQMVWSFFSNLTTLPIQFYYAFEGATNSTAFEIVPACTGDMENQWCRILFGLDVINSAIAHSILYPMIIVGIVVATVIIFWRHIWALLSFRYK